MTHSKKSPITRAIILSAGQGRRLLPLTEDRPKCLLTIAGKTLIEWQIDNLLSAGVQEILVVTGFATDRVEALLEERYGSDSSVSTVYNPFYSVTDNLVSCWMARDAMNTDFLLLNGDTVFEPELLQQVIASPSAPVTLTVDHKESYDSDDMKVEMAEDGTRLRHVSKTIPPERIHAESIGLICFRENGPERFWHAVEAALREPAGLKSWYLSVIDSLAAEQIVTTCSIDGFRWTEIDFIEDLAEAESRLTGSGDAGTTPDYILERSSA